METTTLTLDGLTVRVSLERTEDGPLLRLEGENCNLEGVLPGEYVLAPLQATAPAS